MNFKNYSHLKMLLSHQLKMQLKFWVNTVVSIFLFLFLSLLFLLSFVTIYLLADLHYLNFLNQLMAIRSSNSFSHFWPGAFHMLYKHTTDATGIIKSGRMKNKQAWTWVSPKSKKGKVFGTFLAFCASVSITSMNLNKNSYTATRSADSSSRTR